MKVLLHVLLLLLLFELLGKPSVDEMLLQVTTTSPGEKNGVSAGRCSK
jgi:hypothetical protein